MKPSEKCKAAGLKGLAELVGITGRPYRTLLHWAKNDEKRFDYMVRSAAAEKTNKVKEIG